MKKALMVLLAAIMALGSLGSVIWFLLPHKPTTTNPLADIPDPVIRSFRFSDFSGLDTSTLDFSDEGENYLTWTFDTTTEWPPAEKMPEGFSPEDLMARGKDLGLGLKALHDSGITGAGVSVAVIDKPIPADHEAYSKNIEYVEVKPGNPKMEQTHYHGAACATILAGDYGVAPESKLYYFAVPDDSQPYLNYAAALNLLLQVNEDLPQSEKIRVVSVSHGIDYSQSGAMEWLAAIGKAEEQGVIVVYPGMFDLNYTGAGCPPNRDRNNPANYEAWTWTVAKQQIVGKLEVSGASSFDTARAELKRLLTQDPDLNVLHAEAIHTFLYLLEMAKKDPEATYEDYLWSMITPLSETVAVPADYLTVASDKSPTSYVYYGSGGLSWATPYVAGLLALGLQVNPSATPSELFEAIMATAHPLGEDGVDGKLVNPAGFIDALR